MTTARRAVIEEMYDPTIGYVVANETAPHRCLQHQPEPNHINYLGVEMAGQQSTQILQSRVNLALSILDHREYSPENWNIALAALKGASITDLMDPPGDA